MDVSLHHRFAIGQYTDVSGDVISHLNISHVRPDDGGLYKCVASNSMGHAEHSARLNVYGRYDYRWQKKYVCCILASLNIVNRVTKKVSVFSKQNTFFYKSFDLSQI